MLAKNLVSCEFLKIKSYSISYKENKIWTLLVHVVSSSKLKKFKINQNE